MFPVNVLLIFSPILQHQFLFFSPSFLLSSPTSIFYCSLLDCWGGAKALLSPSLHISSWRRHTLDLFRSFFNPFWVPFNPNPPLLHLVFLSLSSTLLSGKCRHFSHMFHMDWKRSKASGDHQGILCQEMCGNHLDGKKKGFLIGFFFPFSPPPSGISLWKNALIVHLFIFQKIMG